MVDMMQNDLLFMLPNSNGVRICDLAIKELSHKAVNLVDAMKSTSPSADESKVNSEPLLNHIYDQVEAAKETLSVFDVDVEELPANLSLQGPESTSDKDPALVQFGNMLAWDSFITEPDPGTIIIDLLIETYKLLIIIYYYFRPSCCTAKICSR